MKNLEQHNLENHSKWQDLDNYEQLKAFGFDDYHIKKCEGPCEGLVNENKYNEMIIRICKFLEGKTKPTKDHLKKLMENSSKNLLFEEAAKYRDQLKAINSFVDKQSKSKIDFKDRDVLGIAKKDNFGIMVIIRIRNGRIFSREKISLQRLDSNDKNTKVEVFWIAGMNGCFL